MSAIFGCLQSLWVLWLVLLFLGICAWAFWPGNRRRFEAQARLPLDVSEREP